MSDKPVDQAQGLLGTPSHFSLSALLTFLLGRAQPRLTRSDWQWLDSHAYECAEGLAYELESLVTSIACVSAADGDDGNFQDDGRFSMLLFFLSKQISLLDGLQHVGNYAAAQLRGDRESV